VASFGLPLPNNYFDLSLIEQIDHVIEHALPDLVRWTESGWAAVNPLFQTGVLFTRDDDLQNQPSMLFRSILDFFGLRWRSANFQPAAAKGSQRDRNGNPEGWRLR